MTLYEMADFGRALVTDGHLSDITYYQFDDESNPPKLPYAAYYEGSTRSYFADNQTYFREDPPITLELYTRRKDLALEAEIERRLDGKRWERVGTQWLSSEQTYQTLYYVY